MWPNAVDEILRLEAPVQLTARVCRRATELAGQPIRVGQPVTTILAAANRDPGVFADPHTFDVTRKQCRAAPRLLQWSPLLCRRRAGAG